MAFDPSFFWGMGASENPPLLDSKVSEAEQQLGVALPTDFISLLKIKNGGITLGFGHAMPTRTSWADNHVPFFSMNGIGIKSTRPSRYSILDRDYFAEEWGLPPEQVLLTGEGHWWITLDYSGSANPVVTWLDVDEQRDIVIAPSFSAFLNGLRPIQEFN